MSGRGKSKKARIEMEKPELPAFIQRMKQQIVANEDSERRERSDQRRRERPARPEDLDDDPTVVKLGADDLTESEYKRLKAELETQYKLGDETKGDQKHKSQELDIDLIMNSRKQAVKTDPKKEASGSTSQGGARTRERHADSKEQTKQRASVDTRKVLSYGSSSSSSDED